MSAIEQTWDDMWYRYTPCTPCVKGMALNIYLDRHHTPIFKSITSRDLLT